MSKQLINQYYNNLDRAIQFGKSTNETAIRNHFWILLNEYARKQNYEVVTEISCQGTKGKKVYPDGIVKNLFGLDIGLWESKDEKTSIDDEISLKIRTGYPLTNILFEDSATVILYQRGEESMRIPMRDADKLHSLITAFISFKNETVFKFEVALENFKADIPKIVESLRASIEDKGNNNSAFMMARTTFLELCKAEINPEITLADVREMMIQHMLTSDIFNRIFGDPDFHRHNTIARELEKLIDVLFTYSERRNQLGDIDHYYSAISAAAAEVTDHHEKQKFLKVLYENFYKVYNPKAADRLGVVYTPNEIVQFMIESTDYLLGKHFGKSLADNNVDILDPATGTGTFITSIIDHIPKHLLANKYKNELHANEVAILPYYIANLNVEFTFKQKMGYYEEFKSLCFVDTLDNVDGLAYAGKQHNIFGLSSENSERIQRQNNKRISVIIGNPPYNANQANFNDANKNRVYPVIDKRIKETFIKNSAAVNKGNLYDMYTRFYRWAMDRVDRNGIIALITNNSYINKQAFDGFRKVIQDEFDFSYIIDLGGNIRELSGKDGIWLNEENTIFGVAAAVGISIMFLVKKESEDKNTCQINYIHPTDIRATRIEKLDYLKSHSLDSMPFERIKPDKKYNWIDLADTDFESLIPLIDKAEFSVFKSYSLGVVTNRDEWNYDFSSKNLSSKMNFFTEHYNSTLNSKNKDLDNIIKWSDTLKRVHSNNKKVEYDKSKILKSLYKPYTHKFFYAEKTFNDRLTANHVEIFGKSLSENNSLIGFIGNGTTVPFPC
jgi:predicted helicase